MTASNETRDYVNRLLKEAEEERYARHLQGAEKFDFDIDHIRTLEKIVRSLAGEIDSIKDDLDWHGVVEGHHRSAAQ